MSVQERNFKNKMYIEEERSKLYDLNLESAISNETAASKRDCLLIKTHIKVQTESSGAIFKIRPHYKVQSPRNKIISW